MGRAHGARSRRDDGSGRGRGGRGLHEARQVGRSLREGPGKGERGPVVTSAVHNL